MSLNLKSLVGRLTDGARRGLEGAAGLSVSRTHYDVEMEHWLAKLAESTDGDVARILQHFGIAPERFIRDLERVLDGYRTGNGARPHLAPSIEDLLREAWVQASINYGHSRVRSGVILLAALTEPGLRRRLVEASPSLSGVSPDGLGAEFVRIVEGAPEDREVLTDRPGGEPITAGGPALGTRALDQFTVDLTALARAGSIDPVVGREAEIRQTVDILIRRRKNNPILTGEAGVGKTAVVEGLAIRIAAGDVHPLLRNAMLRTLDIGLLQAGAGVRGEFENRLRQVIEEVRASVHPVLLFIDEAHMLIGAGGAEGQADAANLLKPALARGELRTIAATTWAEYKKYFEKDDALSRRFEVVKVDEPSEATATIMMRGVAERLERHHGVRILDEAVVDSVRLSSRYLSGRQLPDKSVSVLDTACARVALGQSATPAAIEEQRSRINAFDLEVRVLERESMLGSSHEERIQAVRASREEASQKLGVLEQRHAQELDLHRRIVTVRNRIEAAAGIPPIRAPETVSAVRPDTPEHVDLRVLEPMAASAASRTAVTDAEHARDSAAEPPSPIELQRLRAELAALQGAQPLVKTEVDAGAVAEVLSAWTGIPVGRMLADEIQTVLELERRLGRRVIGQDHALRDIAKGIQISRARIEHPGRPIGVFLLVGPSGVGKTETALALAEALYGGDRHMITINMSEYQEPHTVSKLKGSPPGYVGYGEGGVLTEAVRRRPYSVVLLDESDKAHPQVMDLFHQVFDRGMLEDGEGREIDFKNTVILLTCNAGTDTIVKLCADPGTRPDPEQLAVAVRPALQQEFPASLLGRMTVVPYYPITPDMLERIARLQLERVAERTRSRHGAAFVYGEDVVAAVVAQCNEPESGARAIDRVIGRSLLPGLGVEILSRMMRGEPFTRIEAVGAGGGFRYSIT